MSPQKHILCGTLLSIGIIIKYNEFDTAMSCLFGSVISDADHVFEYAKYCIDYSVKPTVREFISGTYFDKKETVCIFFHGWEFAAVGVLYLLLKREGTIDNVIKGIVIGYISHMILDQIGNNVSIRGYFWLYRWWHDWKQKSLLN